MTAREFLSNIAVLSSVMALAALIEAVVPMFGARAATRGRRAANLGLTTVVFLLNWGLSSAVAALALALSVKPPAWAGALGVPMLAQVVAGVLVLDFSAGYLSHRALHMSPFLWRFHQVHHSDDFVDVTTTYRTHPVETLWRFLFIVVPVWLLGIPPLAVVIQRLVSTVNGILDHGNIRIAPRLDAALSSVWVTPNVHKIHHSRARAETNSNYGNVLTLYDRLLGTFTPAARAADVAYGLDEADSSRIGSLPGLLTMPFEGDGSLSLTEKSGSVSP